MAFNISSTAFENGKTIPSRYTCDGENVSPQIYWDDVPRSATSLALIVEDPDAPGGTFTHWILYNINPKTPGLNPEMPLQHHLKDESVQVNNDMNNYGYGGPCPPKGEEHRYFFKLFALNKKLPPEGIRSREDFYSAIKNIVIDETEYMGVYRKK